MVATGRIRQTDFYSNLVFGAVSERLRRVHLHGSSSGFDRRRHKSGYSTGLWRSERRCGEAVERGGPRAGNTGRMIIWAQRGRTASRRLGSTGRKRVRFPSRPLQPHDFARGPVLADHPVGQFLDGGLGRRLVECDHACQVPSWNENMNCFSDLAINSENISRRYSHY